MALRSVRRRLIAVCVPTPKKKLPRALTRRPPTPIPQNKTIVYGHALARDRACCPRRVGRTYLKWGAFIQRRTGRNSPRAEVRDVPLSAGAICQIRLASLSSAATPSAGSGHERAAARTSAIYVGRAAPGPALTPK